MPPAGPWFGPRFCPRRRRLATGHSLDGMRLRRLAGYRIFDGDRRARFFLTLLILLVGFILVGALGA